MYGTVVAIDPIWGHCTGHSYTIDKLSDAGVFIERHAVLNHNLYWTPNAVGGVVNKKPLKTDISAMRYVHVDIDDPSEAALAKLRAYVPAPTMIVFSGGGYNVYWRLAEPIHVNGNIAKLEALNKRVIADLGGDIGTGNLDRILRLPGTTNYPTKAKIKRGRVPVEANLIEHHPERAYSPDDFPSGPVLGAKPAGAETAKASATDAYDAGKTDRSKDLLRRIAADVRHGLSDDDIHAARDSHEHAADQSDPARAVQRCIDKVRSDEDDIVARINEKNALIWVNGKLLVMWPSILEDGLPRLSHVADVRIYWKTEQHGKTNPVDIWLRSRQRTEYSGFIFRPASKKRSRSAAARRLKTSWTPRACRSRHRQCWTGTGIRCRPERHQCTRAGVCAALETSAREG